MADPSSRHRWTVRFVRADGQASHSWTARRPLVLLAILTILAVPLAAGAVLGRAWALRTESATLATLRTETDRLRLENGRVTELAARLARIEADYERLRSAVTTGRPATDPAVEIPPEAPGSAGTDEVLDVPTWPLAQAGFITRTFGSPGGGSSAGHPGIDIAVPVGSYVRAMSAGTVEEAGEDDVYGLFVRIAHEDGLSSLYGHNSWLFAQPGDRVERQQVIALSGNTGRSTAPHLHFEVARGGELLDPLAFVNEGGSRAAGGSGQRGVEPR